MDVRLVQRPDQESGEGVIGVGALTAKQRRFVWAFVHNARANATEAAKLAGYSASSRATLAELGHQTLRNVEVAAAIEAEFAAFRDQGAAIKKARIAGKQERLSALWAVVDARAGRYAAEFDQEAAQAAKAFFGQGVPAEALTGMLARRETVAGRATVVEWAVDTGLLKEMRELENDIRAEVGEDPGVNVKHSGRVAHTHRALDLSGLSDDDLEGLAAIAEKVGTGELVP